ncbi:unnamed protein product [Heterobilharzia americana]|nr:unnamed protein product [Heterobilharzia americana]
MCSNNCGNLSKLRTVLEEFSLDYSLIQLKLHENHGEKMRAFECLHKIMHRILRDPLNESHRRITLTSTDFTETLLVIPGCMDFLFSAGFQEADDSFVLPITTDLSQSRKLLNQLNSCLSINSEKLCQNTLELMKSEVIFVEKLLGYRSFVVNYMDLKLQTRARELIPTEQLLVSASQNTGCSVDKVEPRDFLQELMLWFKGEFFKWADNFECKACGSKMVSKSTDQPRQNEMDGDANVVEVYICKSNPKHPPYRFPRYNNPKKLLETRLGRCGEWANCFTLFLVSVERSSHQPWFESCRLIMDWTDHVWCEVWLEDRETNRKRWIHCDPCEGQIDKPLLYESGWNKKVNYIMAYTVPPRSLHQTLEGSNKLAAIDIQDVTWRYTQNFSEVRSRRHLIREFILATQLANIHYDAVRKWSLFSEESDVNTNPFCWNSIIDELITFLRPPKCVEKLPGRQTGSLEWRKARGELGQTCASVNSSIRGSKYIIRPSDLELKTGIFHLRYNSALNIYERLYYIKTNASDVNCYPTKNSKGDKQELLKITENARETGLYGWQSMVYEWRNICRKVELDWHMVYLAREEDSDPFEDGIITWMLDLRNTDYRVGKVSLFTNMVCHSSESHAQLILCSGEYPDSQAENKDTIHSVGSKSCICLQPGSASLFNSELMNGSDFLCLKARLWSDENIEKLSSLAWQQAQLFRQKDNDYDTWSLEWKVELIKSDL